jgi:hypothetical protein
MAGRYSQRRIDGEQGRYDRRFRELEARVASGSTGSLQAVPGSAVSITQVLTDPGGLTAFINTDSIEVAEPGDVAMNLTYAPIPGSLHVRWEPLNVPIENCTLSGATLVVADPDLLFLPGDVISAAYAYDPNIELPPPPVTGGTILAFESSSWKWLQVTRTDATDYSAAAFDDSGWSSAAAAFGDGGNMADHSGPAHTTTWAKTTRMWARRTLTGMTIGGDLFATIRVDRDIVIWLDGTQVYSGSPDGVQATATIDGSYVTATSMVLAVRATDEADSEGDYFDLELLQ